MKAEEEKDAAQKKLRPSSSSDCVAGMSRIESARSLESHDTVQLTQPPASIGIACSGMGSVRAGQHNMGEGPIGEIDAEDLRIGSVVEPRIDFPGGRRAAPPQETALDAPMKESRVTGV